MVAESVVPPQANLLDAAKERVNIGPVPDWIVPCSFRLDFRPKQPGHVTYLLSSKQIHAEKHLAFVHTAIRLETTQAVQNEAQSRIALDPRTQSLTLHWLKIHRAGTVLDRTALENLRWVQRQADGFNPLNHLTLMLLLEDVRPGDVLDLCYTIQEQPLLMREYCGCFFALPEGAPLGKLFFMVRFHDSRPLEWESSSPNLEPVETQHGNETQWVWARENLPCARPEENTPSWHISYPWVQISDCPDWETVATALGEGWNADKADADLAAIIPEMATWEGSILRQIEKAIQWVQDQCRYLALDAVLDERAPTAPEVVARRRYGDAKDLSLLLMVLLKRLGLEARLVLVNGKFRKSLAGLLPMPSLFNHLLVEFKARGETRWVDATAKGQGGGSLNRVICDYGVGLPLERAGSDLVEAPAPAVQANVYRIKESVLLDTSGASSMFAVVVMARGAQAEELRRQFESQGAEAVERQRLQSCVDRFIDVKRASPMEYRDNRTDNEFFLAEVFEISNFLKEDAKSSWCNLQLTAETVAGLLPLPVSGSRLSPFALPHPCDLEHVLEVYCVALPPAIIQQRTIENPWLHFTRMRKTLAGNWTVTTTLATLADSVPPEGINEYREAVREIRTQSTWSLLMPAGQERPHQRGDFGALPASWEVSGVTTQRPANTPAVLPTRSLASPGRSSSSPVEAPAESGSPAAAAPTGQPVQPGAIRYRRRKRHRRRRREQKKILIWQSILAFFLVVVVLLLAIAFFKKTAPKFLRSDPVPPNMRDNNNDSQNP